MIWCFVSAGWSRHGKWHSL